MIDGARFLNETLTRNADRRGPSTRSFVGSIHGSSPCTLHAITVSARRSERNGRMIRPRRTGIPDSALAPEPRARASSTVDTAAAACG